MQFSPSAFSRCSCRAFCAYRTVSAASLQRLPCSAAVPGYARTCYPTTRAPLPPPPGCPHHALPSAALPHPFHARLRVAAHTPAHLPAFPHGGFPDAQWLNAHLRQFVLSGCGRGVGPVGTVVGIANTRATVSITVWQNAGFCALHFYACTARSPRCTRAFYRAPPTTYHCAHFCFELTAYSGPVDAFCRPCRFLLPGSPTVPGKPPPLTALLLRCAWFAAGSRTAH